MRLHGGTGRTLWPIVALIGLSRQQLSNNYNDFTWVANFALVGDSYSAGIGAGSLLDYTCSRYDGSYGAMMAKQFVGLQNFYNLACSGAQSSDILTQIEQLPGGLDLAVMTAGGNDLCLSAILKRCILSATATQASCQAAINLAQTGLNNYLQSNIEALIEALDAKMDSDGVVVIVGYAQFFDATTDACTTEEWTFAGTTNLPLSTSLRAQLNDLVIWTNTALQNAVASVQGTSSHKIMFADWDSWPGTVSGRFCEQGQNPSPLSNDGTVSQLQFFKPNTARAPVRSDILFRRDAFLANSSAFVDEDALHWEKPINMLTKRGIQTPVCAPSSSLNLIPDQIGKWFHPTLWGHASMMTFALNEARTARAEILGIEPPACVSSGVTCNSPRTFYASSDYRPYSGTYAIGIQIADFCSMTTTAINKGEGPVPFQWTYSYYDDAPDQVQFEVLFDQSNSPASYWSQDVCVSSFQSLLTQCLDEVQLNSNPMGWSFGGSYNLGHFTYSLTPQASDKPWPLPVVPTAEVLGQLSTKAGGATTYIVYGTGFADWDFGQTTLLSNLTYCNGGAPAFWDFQYGNFNGGYEWQAFIQTSGASDLICMTSGQTIFYAGGPADSQVHWVTELPTWAPACPSSPDVSSLSCGNSCCGYIPCTSWCNANCGGVVC
ncbi:hypothetical protein TsFJ059_000002 [Trichoderma semiorbis]|uniref:SGNH hydrolase-type esterase domain-containing protein n=2 Tax=Trichoderma semiorbis TaxID=1491008 RepID=A0A9P8HL43_9HYPO|nr:hypothetical protein TsFJ059_000002 [Trichoderma semiorbis]